MNKIRKILGYIRKKMMNNEQYQEWLRIQGVKIGSGCDISKESYFGSEPWLITIGNNTRITRGVEFITHDGGIWTLRKMGLIKSEDVKYGSIYIGDNCNISWNVTIMPNVRIGNNCVIAAGAIVTKDVPDGMVYGGIPAKKIQTVEEYYEKIKNEVVPTFYMSSEQKLEYLKEKKPELWNK